MTKVIYAVRGAAQPELHDPAWHAALREVGAERLQVNLDDEPVAAAMRIPTAEPITAVVSVWLSEDAAPSALAPALTGLTGLVHGWLVDERRPIDPPETWDGSRLDGLANVAVLRRPPELTHDEWLHRWLVDHTSVAIETQATFGYLQNIVVEPVTDGAPEVSAFVEELFPTAAITDIHAFYGSGGDSEELTARITRLMASVARFGADRDLDLVPTSRYLHDLTRC